MKFIIFIFSLIILKNCEPKNSVSNISENQTQFYTAYHVVQINGQNVVNLNLNIMFNNENKQITGFSGCNRFTGPFHITNNTLHIGPLATTRRLCADEKANTIEFKFLEALSKVNSFSIKDATLKLSYKNNIVIDAVQANEISFEYRSSSRMTSQQITITKSTISIKNKTTHNTKNENCALETWNQLLSLLEPITIQNLPKLEPPSKNHQFDGAAIAHLKITLNGKTFETQAFDHGNPPQVIAKLVKEILSISENVE